MLDVTKNLISRKIDKNKPKEELIQILIASIELLSLQDNDFTWSSWEDKKHAVDEISLIIQNLKEGILPEKLALSVLFTATGPMQEVSISSGWSEAFLKVADKYDEVEELIWG